MMPFKGATEDEKTDQIPMQNNRQNPEPKGAASIF